MSAPKYKSLNFSFLELEIEYKNNKNKKINMDIETKNTYGLNALNLLNKKLLKMPKKTIKIDKNTSKIKLRTVPPIFCCQNVLNLGVVSFIFDCAGLLLE